MTQKKHSATQFFTYWQTFSDALVALIAPSLFQRVRIHGIQSVPDASAIWRLTGSALQYIRMTAEAESIHCPCVCSFSSGQRSPSQTLLRILSQSTIRLACRRLMIQDAIQGRCQRIDHFSLTRRMKWFSRGISAQEPAQNQVVTITADNVCGVCKKKHAFCKLQNTAELDSEWSSQHQSCSWLVMPFTL